MRRVLLVILFVLVATSPLFSADDVVDAMDDFVSPSPQMQMMTIGGSLGVETSLSVDVIQGSLTSAEGSPFNIEGEDVLMTEASYSMGRRIAYWTLASNSPPCTLKITALPLTHVENGNAKVPYILRFSYRYLANDKYVADDFFIASEGYTTGNEFYNSLIDSDGYIEIGTAGSMLQIVNSEIRVFIPYDKTNYDYVKNTAPAGAYNATVTITLEGA